jgi:hypothetical protein
MTWSVMTIRRKVIPLQLSNPGVMNRVSFRIQRLLEEAREKSLRRRSYPTQEGGRRPRDFVRLFGQQRMGRAIELNQFDRERNRRVIPAFARALLRRCPPTDLNFDLKVDEPRTRAD